MIAGLRPAEQLVAAERHQRSAVVQRLASGRLAVQPGRRRPGEPRTVRIDQPAADVGDHRHAERRQLGDRRRLDETLRRGSCWDAPSGSAATSAFLRPIALR